jgi:anaerobic selenocysteine-containing dehydrogenase
LRINQGDAARLGIVGRGRALLTTRRGAVEVPVEVTDILQPGHVTLPNGLDGGVVTAREWLRAFATEIDAEAPDDRTVETLLALAGHAAHASERWAAPLACWIVGRAAVDPSAALERAKNVALRIGGNHE